MGGAVVLAVVVLLAVALLTGGEEGADEESEDDAASAPFTALAGGGAVLLMRHTLTDTSQTDADPTARGTCDQQRNLSPEGVEQAQAIGAAIRARGIDVDAVLASPFCRAVDTARALDLGEPTPTEALLSLTAAIDADAERRLTTDGTRLIAEHLGGDGTDVMVTHTQNIEALTGELVDEGAAVVLAPGEGEGQVATVGVIDADAW